MKTLELYLIEQQGYATHLVRASGPTAARKAVADKEGLSDDARDALKLWHCEDDGAPGVLMTSVVVDPRPA